MNEILNHFKQLAQIPHCSFQTDEMKDFLIDYARSCGAIVEVDSAGNIHAYKGRPQICLQSHYDMVCMGEAPKIDIFEEGGYLKARDSSLGADNGIGVAIMMEALQKFSHIECLFTNNEEVGLIGANALEHKILAQKFLNLDHESEGDVTIGCAGGVDIFARMDSKEIDRVGEVVEIEVFGFMGGHSGIDILNNKTNAIKTLTSFIAQNHGEVIEFVGGERINSIPRFAKAKAIFPTMPQESPHIRLHSLGIQEAKVSLQSKIFLGALNSFSHGLRSFNVSLGIPQTSINLAIAKLVGGKISIDLFARSNNSAELEAIRFETLEFFHHFGFYTGAENFYYPWEPKESAFSNEVFEAMQKNGLNPRYYAIHAGLECGIIGAKQSNLQCCSIGPNISLPHSTSERCEIASIQRITKIVFELIDHNQPNL